MPVFVNLSATHTLHPITKSVKAFTDLCDQYSKGWFSSWFPALQSKINYLWVMVKYCLYNETLIKPYKLGYMTTEHFLNQLLDIFSFLKNVQFLEVNNNNTYPGALGQLENAWNAIIDIDEDTASRLPKIIEQFPSENIYLISNSNEINALKALDLLRKNTNIGIFRAKEIDISVTESREPVQIAPNVYICLSYRYQLFKTLGDTKQVNPNSTTSLMEHLIKKNLPVIEKNWEDSNISDSHLISQFKGDLDAAPGFGLMKEHVHHANTFFAKPGVPNQRPTERTPLLATDNRL